MVTVTAMLSFWKKPLPLGGEVVTALMSTGV
jgi:hypothetical protein